MTIHIKKEIIVDKDILMHYLYEVDVSDSHLASIYCAVLNKIHLELEERGGIKIVEKDTVLSEN